MSGFKTLMYHDIIRREDFSEEKRGPICVADGYQDTLPPFLFTYFEDFREQMRYLKEEGWHTLTLAEIQDFYENKAAIPEKSVHLTFDDLYKSVAMYAIPILREYGFKATGFCVKSWVFDKPQPYDALHPTTMSWTELADIHDVLELANHSDSLHQRIGELSSILSWAKEDVISDLASCGEKIDNPFFFAYPFGIYNKETLERLESAGIRYAYTSDPGINNPDTNPLELYRCFAPLGTDREGFAAILDLGEHL